MVNDELKASEDKLDEAIEESFPASDPPSNTIETGIHVGPPDDAVTVRDNLERHRFEMAVGDHIAFLQYERRAEGLVLIHTEVPPPLRGRGLSSVLIKSAIETAHAEGLAVIAQCPLVREYLRKHPGGR